MKLLLPQRKSDSESITGYALWCPACKHAHILRTVGEKPDLPFWHFDENMTAPNFRPSYVTWGGEYRCHFNVVNGQLQFLPDCSHEFAGKTIPMVDWDTVNKAKSA